MFCFSFCCRNKIAAKAYRGDLGRVNAELCVTKDRQPVEQNYGSNERKKGKTVWQA